jgi:hypothetical protein
MAGTKRIVDVEVESLYESAYEFWIIRLFARVEAQILHHRDSRHHCGKRLANRLHGESGIHPALGASQVAAHGHQRTVRAQPFECGDRGAETKVVGHFEAAVFFCAKWGIEIRPDENASSPDRGQILEGR